MTRLALLSDVHLEHGKLGLPALPEGVDVVLAAGDIHNGAYGVSALAAAYPDVLSLYVAGNHEFYGYEYHELLDELRAAAQATANVKLLERDVFDFGCLRFLGTTLWTDFQLFGPGQEWLAKQAALRGLADCELIQYGSSQWSPNVMQRLFGRSSAWLKHMLCEPFAGKRVVITHHAPSFKSVAPCYQADLLSAAFASELLPTLPCLPDLWVHGHTHAPFDYQAGDCRVVCHPRGYPTETRNAAAYQPLLIEL